MITPGKDGQMQEQIDISKTSAIKCEACEKCSHINKEFLEAEIKEV